ncbi:MAG: MarR family transcriptional regulator [Paludibacter sp.]|nr:MarR family transcriptional regulator [Paludibacter sp.]
MNKIDYQQSKSSTDNMFSIYTMLGNHWKQTIRKKTNLTPSILLLLFSLERHDILSMSEIGARLGMSKPNVTAYVNSLFADDMVERLPEEKDRRIIYIRLTKKGKNCLENFKTDISEDLRQRIDLLPSNKISVLQTASTQVQEILTEIMTKYIQKK